MTPPQWRTALAREADVHLDVSVEVEACPLDLAPTSSTTSTAPNGARPDTANWVMPASPAGAPSGTAQIRAIPSA